MTKIAVEIKNDIVSNIATEKSAQTYAFKPDWNLVENDPAFLISEKYLWTVRKADNVLVHKNTNQTPEEEKNTVITQLTLQNLQQANEINELKKISTSQTLQNLQDTKDKEEQQKVITNQTVQILSLQKSISDIKSENTTN